MTARLPAAAALAALATLGLSACETATPYQPIGAPGAQASGGYADQQIEGDRWRVSFSGNSLTSRETVERYLLFRAAQLTLNRGYDWFTTVQRNTNRKTDYVGDSFGPWGGYWAPDWGLYRRGYGWGYGAWAGPGFGWRNWGAWGPGWGAGPVDIEQVDRYQASAEIVMGHGQKPGGDPHAFDARAVVDHLQASIRYPDARSS
jgi:hypothetical protein